MSNDNDKTVFQPPGAGGDQTILRPTPGGRGGQPQMPTAQPPPPPPMQPSAPQQPAPQQQYQPQAPQQPPLEMGGYFATTSGLNPLVNAASTLIAVYEKAKQSVTHPNVGGLHQRLVSEIKSFEVKAKEAGMKPEVVLAARYVLCAAVDEAVLNTPWGAESPWGQRTLLSLFHNETSGGEKFFVILERMKEQPAVNLYMLELMYVLLSLGFEGKYRVIHRGRDAIEQLRDNLFEIIRRHRGDYERTLSPSWRGLGKAKNSLASYLPTWVVASVVGLLLFAGYSGLRIWLYDASTPALNKLDEIVQVDQKNKPDSDKQQ